MDERKNLKHGQAKVQFTACLEKIMVLQKAGYSVKAIYNQLYDDGVITMSYNGFHRNIGKLATHVKRNRKGKAVIDRDVTVIARPQPFARPINRPQTVVLTSPVMPTDKIISVADIMAEKLAASKEFTETQSVPDEDEGSHKTMLDTHIGA